MDSNWDWASAGEYFADLDDGGVLGAGHPRHYLRNDKERELMKKQWYLDQLDQIGGDAHFDAWNGTSWMNLISLALGEGVCCETEASAGEIDEEVRKKVSQKLMDGIKYRKDLTHEHHAECRWLDLHAQFACDVLVAIIDGIDIDESWINDRLAKLGLKDEMGEHYSSPRSCPERSPEEIQLEQETREKEEQLAEASFFPHTPLSKCPQIRCNLFENTTPSS